MWIEKQTNPITYSDIKAGDIFDYEGKTYIKTNYCSQHSNDRLCCVNLITGDLNYLFDSEEVLPLKGKVVIE